MKSLFAVFGAALVMATVVGCSGGDQGPTEDNGTEAVSTSGVAAASPGIYYTCSKTHYPCTVETAPDGKTRYASASAVGTTYINSCADMTKAGTCVCDIQGTFYYGQAEY